MSEKQVHVANCITILQILSEKYGLLPEYEEHLKNKISDVWKHFKEYRDKGEIKYFLDRMEHFIWKTREFNHLDAKQKSIANFLHEDSPFKDKKIIAYAYVRTDYNVYCFLFYSSKSRDGRFCRYTCMETSNYISKNLNFDVLRADSFIPRSCRKVTPVERSNDGVLEEGAPVKISNDEEHTVDAQGEISNDEEHTV
ncbi:hypothetical protein TVAGG3_0231750, partial [Trichomonas vaginalis G3]|uniref:hypothetical protein n=1 Tax=Trichomonas vaginalis (strain ATCC PRA-98 / G3) TaxID=412133 RepID=UPI0021E563AB